MEYTMNNFIEYHVLTSSVYMILGFLTALFVTEQPVAIFTNGDKSSKPASGKENG